MAEFIIIPNKTVPTNGPVNIPVDIASGYPDCFSPNYRLIGATDPVVLIGNVTIAPLGVPVANQKITFYNEANYTLGAFSITIFGVAVPASLATKNFKVESVYNGTTAAWVTSYYIAVNEDQWIQTSDIEDLAVTTNKLDNLAVTTAKLENGGAGVGVTNAKMAEMPTNTVKGNDGAGPAVPQDLTMTELRTILAQTIQITGAFTSGPVAENPATGLTTLPVVAAANSINTAEIVDGAVTKIKLAASSVDSTKLTYGAGGPITVGPVTSQFILPGTFKALLDGVTNSFFTLETGDILLNVQVFVGAASGVVQTIDIGFDANIDFNGTGADANGVIEAANSNAQDAYSALSSGYDGAAFRTGNLIAAATGDLTVTSSADLTATGIVAYAIITYMHA